MVYQNLEFVSLRCLLPGLGLCPSSAVSSDSSYGGILIAVEKGVRKRIIAHMALVQMPPSMLRQELGASEVLSGL